MEIAIINVQRIYVDIDPDEIIEAAKDDLNYEKESIMDVDKLENYISDNIYELILDTHPDMEKSNFLDDYEFDEDTIDNLIETINQKIES
jgi:predicted transcriptional regulator